MPPGPPYEGPYSDRRYLPARVEQSLQGPLGMPGGPGPDYPIEDGEEWEPLPPRSRRPAAALAAIVLVSGISGFGTFAYIAGNTEHVTSADGSGAPVVTTTTTVPEEATTTSSTEPAEDDEESETTDTSEGQESESTTTTAPPDDSGDSSPGLSPEDTVTAFFKAMNEGDCEAAIDYTSEQSWSRGGTVTREQAIQECGQSGPPMGGIEVKDAKLANQEGDSATVDVSLSQGGQTMTVPMMLTREGGQWKLVSM